MKHHELERLARVHVKGGNLIEEFQAALARGHEPSRDTEKDKPLDKQLEAMSEPDLAALVLHVEALQAGQDQNTNIPVESSNGYDKPSVK